MEKRSVCFVANNTEFLFRHFSPAISAAQEAGLKIFAVLPQGSYVQDEWPSIHVIPAPIDRRSFSFFKKIFDVFWLVRKLRQVKPSIAVVYSLRASVVMALALPFIPRSKVVLVITGLGLLDLMTSVKLKVIRALSYAAIRRAASSKRCYLIFENNSDAAKIGLDASQRVRSIVLMGAGVDPSEFAQQPFPPFPPFRFATMSRLIWSKGVDLAVQAVSELARDGYAVELDIYGEPDFANPFPSDVTGWEGLPGVSYKGRTDRVSEVWRDHHAAIFVSRGGEGLPRALLEAAMSGRPCIVTNVPGCADLIRDGIEGFVVAPESVVEIKAAILKLIAQPEDLTDFGARARDRVLSTSTFQLVESTYDSLFDAT